MTTLVRSPVSSTSSVPPAPLRVIVPPSVAPLCSVAVPLVSEAVSEVIVLAC